MPRKKTVDIADTTKKRINPFMPDAPILFNKKGKPYSANKGLVHTN